MGLALLTRTRYRSLHPGAAAWLRSAPTVLVNARWVPPSRPRPALVPQSRRRLFHRAASPFADAPCIGTVNGAIAYTKGYGVRHRENGGVIDDRTMFRIGSSTKMMTAAALMTLVDAGKLDLHAPITDYLPDLHLPAPWQASAITNCIDSHQAVPGLQSDASASAPPASRIARAGVYS